MKTFVLAGALALASPAWAQPAADGTLSFLAFGDTGKQTSWPERVMPQYRVGEAMSREDRRRPVQALLLLGDNFYGSGVTPATLERRVGQNLAGPYCYFLALTSLGREKLHDDCHLAPEQTHPIPFLAVLGNHDTGSPDAVPLQRHGIAEYVGNWVLPEEAHSYELGAGVSLILYHSSLIAHGEPTTALVRALRASKGPWRILAAHHPIADPGAGLHPEDAQAVLDAIAEAGKPVQLMLAGHQHSLQAIRSAGAALHIVSGGGGAVIRHVSPTPADRLFAEARYGFARIDVSPDALDVTLFSLFGPLDKNAEARAKFRVTPAGEVTQLPLK